MESQTSLAPSFGLILEDWGPGERAREVAAGNIYYFFMKRHRRNEMGEKR